MIIMKKVPCTFTSLRSPAAATDPTPTPYTFLYMPLCHEMVNLPISKIWSWCNPTTRSTHACNQPSRYLPLPAESLGGYDFTQADKGRHAVPEDL